MTTRAFRSSAIGVTFIARQFGVRVNTDAIEEAINAGTLSNSKEFAAYFFTQGIQVKARKLKPEELVSKAYIYPCVAIMKDGRSFILAGADTSRGPDKTKVIAIDPMDPTAQPVRIELPQFVNDWAGQIVLVSKSSGNPSTDRPFDWQWFLPELYRFKGVMALTFVISLLLHALGITPIIYIQISLDKVLGYEATATLYVLIAAVTLALIFNGILSYGRDYVINHICTTIEARLTGDIFDKMLNLPAQTFHTTSPADMEGKVQSVVAVRMFLARQVLTNLYDATGILVFVPILFGYSPVLALVVILFSIAQGGIDLASKYRQRAIGGKVGEANMSRIRTLRETIGGIDTVKTLSQEPIQRREWRNAAASIIRRNTEMSSLTNLTGSINATLMSLMTVAIVFTGINLVFAGSLSAGAIISCNMLGAKVVSPIKGLITFFANTHIINSAMAQISSIWNANPERTGSGSQQVIQGGFQIRDVTVKFDDHAVLDKISLDIPTRGKVVIVGPSGSGKSTLLRLLQGLLKPSEGMIEVDGVNLASVDLSFYRSQVALVDRYPSFFAGAIDENLRRVRPNISARELEVIIETSGLGLLSENLPEGLSSTIDQTASNLSQAHKIVVGLARALASAPNLLLLDETFNSLDKRVLVHLKKNLNQIAQGRTLVTTTHDMRFVPDYDWIIVLDKGKVIGQGKHDELLSNCPLYAELWRLEKQIDGSIPQAEG